MIDLHTHSTFSDGSCTPAELVAAARAAGLTALALTDHDTAAGGPEFLAACRACGLTGLAGVEISAEVPSGTLHVLGYGIDPRHAGLHAQLGNILDGRDWRNRRILERLAALGIVLTWDEVAGLAGEDVVGRPHFAQAMLKRGYVANLQEAFDRFLAKGAPAYVDRFRLLPADGIRAIREAGGLPVIAHPFTWLADYAQLAAALGPLVTAGLGGLECYYSEYTREQEVAYLRLARQFGLLATGGTDFHGASKPDLRLGVGFGQTCVPDALLPAILEALAGSPGVAAGPAAG